MADLSDANIRAVLAVLLTRQGGEVDIANTELYDAMLPGAGAHDGIAVVDTPTGVRVSLRPHLG